MTGRLRAAIRRRRPLLSVVPTQRLALALALLAPLWLLPGGWGARAAMGATALLALVAAADMVLLPGRGDLRVEREPPAGIGLGDPTDVRTTVRSTWPRPVHVTLTEVLPPQLRGGIGMQSARLAARGSLEIEGPVTGLVRGQWAFGPVALRVRSRLGLIARRLVVRDDAAVLVAPSIAGVRRFRLLAMQHRLQSAGVHALRHRGEGRAFAGLREYVVGDDPRHMDWKASARRRKPIVREFTIERAQTVIALVDAGRSMTQLAGDYPRFEHALSAALVLTDVAASAGDRVGALVFDDEIRAFVPPRRGRAALRAVRNGLLPVTATMAEPDYAAAFRFLAARQRRRALIVFFTDVVDVRASRALLAHLARSAARHLVVVVALKNDALFTAADEPGHGELSLYRQAVAEELVLARREALERMRRAGVSVIDVSPHAMTAALVNRYLEIKARGAL